MKIALGLGPYGENCRVAGNDFCERTGTFALVSQTAYFVYLGFCAELVTPATVRASQTVASATITTAEMGFFSTVGPPNATGVTLTKIAAATFTGTGTGLKSSTTMSTALTATTHLWAGIRVNATTAGTFSGLARDWSAGHVLSLASSGAFSSTNTYAGALAAFADATTVSPDLYGII